MNTQEQARAAVQRMVDQAQERARSAEAMVRDLDAVHVTGTARDGTAVVLGHTGGLIEVRLSDRLGRADLAQIEASIAQANADAQFRLRSTVSELAARHYGQDSETARHFQRQYEQLFPHAEETDKPDRPGGAGVLR